jgi:cyanate lyase
MNRLAVTEKIIATKVSKGIKWEDVAKKVGHSKEWTTALCLGQMTATPAQAKTLGKIFGLTADEQKWLCVVPYKGSLPTQVPTDPLIYRWYEIVNVYGTTIKELIHEEFGDGIMSAIDSAWILFVSQILKAIGSTWFYLANSCLIKLINQSAWKFQDQIFHQSIQTACGTPFQIG